MEVSPALFPDHLRASLASCDVATSQTLVTIDACLKRLSDLDNVLKPVTSAISPVLGRTPSGPLLTGPQDIPKHLATIRAVRRGLAACGTASVLETLVRDPASGLHTSSALPTAAPDQHRQGPCGRRGFPGIPASRPCCGQFPAGSAGQRCA